MSDILEFDAKEITHIKTKAKPELMKIRKAVDEIDKIIIDLLVQRTEYMVKAGKLKSEYIRPGTCYITSARESDMVKDLVEKIEGPFPKEAVVSVWRNIISASVNVEDKSRVTACDDYYAEALLYFGSFIDLEKSKSPEVAIAKLIDGSRNIAVLPIDKDAKYKWWVDLSHDNKDLKVFTRVPFVLKEENKDREAFCISKINHEKTKEDKSLIVVCATENNDKDTVIAELKRYDINAEYRDETVLENFRKSFLLEAEGHFTDDEERARLFSQNNEINGFINTIGSFATPIKL